MVNVPLLFEARGEEGQCCGQEGIKEFLLASGRCDSPQTTTLGLWKSEAGKCRRGTCLASSPKDLVIDSK